jgi:hypothetical protein
VRRTRWSLTRVIVDLASVLDLVAILFLPWRNVGDGNPFHIGSRLYQMGLPVQLTGLIVMAAIAVVAVHVPGPAVKSSATLVISGLGTMFLCLLVVSSSAAQVVPTSGATSLREVGYVMAFACGLLTLAIGLLEMVLVYREHRTARTDPASARADADT